MERKMIITKNIEDSVALKQTLLRDKDLLDKVVEITGAIVDCYRSGGKVLFCGNGGSAADAQHLAAELSGRYYLDRDPLFAEALHVNTSYLTAVANDYSFDEIFARLVKATGQSGDILIGLSTSGNSANVIKALQAAQVKKMTRVALTGSGGGAMKDHCDFLIEIPSSDTPRIQECHLMLGHAICETVEIALFSNDK